MVKDRIVSVRGLAEREVQADHVIWPLVYETTSDNLQEAMSDINRGNNKIRQWLIKHGLKPADISMGAPQINDRATQYDGDYRGLRYKASCTTTVSTSNVALVRQLMPQLGQLVEMGVAIAAADYDSQVQYEFTSLNKIKPQMSKRLPRTRASPARNLPAIRIASSVKSRMQRRVSLILLIATMLRLISRKCA